RFFACCLIQRSGGENGSWHAPSAEVVTRAAFRLFGDRMIGQDWRGARGSLCIIIEAVAMTHEIHNAHSNAVQRWPRSSVATDQPNHRRVGRPIQWLFG